MFKIASLRCLFLSRQFPWVAARFWRTFRGAPGIKERGFARTTERKQLRQCLSCRACKVCHNHSTACICRLLAASLLAGRLGLGATIPKFSLTARMILPLRRTHVLLVMWLGTKRHDVCGDSPTGRKHHPYESDRSSPEEPVDMDLQKWELWYGVANVAIWNSEVAAQNFF